MQTATISKAMFNFLSKFHIQILWYSFTRKNRFVPTPFQSLQVKQENPSSCVSRHVNSSLLNFSLDSELINTEVEVFFVTKKQ